MATVKELKAMAKAQGVKGFSTMKKSTLAYVVMITKYVGKDFRDSNWFASREHTGRYIEFLNELLDKSENENSYKAKWIVQAMVWAISTARATFEFRKALVSSNPYKLADDLLKMESKCTRDDYENMKKYFQVDEYEQPAETETKPGKKPEPKTKKASTKKYCRFEIGQSYSKKHIGRVYTVIARGRKWIDFQDNKGNLYHVTGLAHWTREFNNEVSYDYAEFVKDEDVRDLHFLTSDSDLINTPASDTKEITETTAQYLPALPEIPEATLQDEAPALPEIQNQAQKPQADDHAPALPEKPREIKSWPVIFLAIIIAITHKQGIIFYTQGFLKITNPKPPPIKKPALGGLQQKIFYGVLF